MYRKFIKRLFDLIISIHAFIFLFPLFLLISIVLLFVNGGYPFFLQSRPGKNEVIFTLIKFKTMTDKKDELGELLSDEARLTKIGIFIRSTSLDEIPQLLNIIKGDMSLVGPRPLLVRYLERYSKEQKRRHEVKPGITGWAQINGRNAISWKERFEYDIDYVDNLSFGLDIKILFKTLLKVVKREGVSSKASVTMEEFKG